MLGSRQQLTDALRAADIETDHPAHDQLIAGQPLTNPSFNIQYEIERWKTVSPSRSSLKALTILAGTTALYDQLLDHERRVRELFGEEEPEPGIHSPHLVGQFSSLAHAFEERITPVGLEFACEMIEQRLVEDAKDIHNRRKWGPYANLGGPQGTADRSAYEQIGSFSNFLYQDCMPPVSVQLVGVMSNLAERFRRQPSPIASGSPGMRDGYRYVMLTFQRSDPDRAILQETLDRFAFEMNRLPFEDHRVIARRLVWAIEDEREE